MRTSTPKPFDLMKALDESKKTHPDREERIDWLWREHGRIQKTHRFHPGMYERTEEGVVKMLTALGEEV